MNWIKVSIINLTVFVSLIFLIEIVYAFYNNFNRGEKCELNWIKYNYCPNIKTKKKNNPSDGGEIINIEVDKLGGRISKNGISTLETAEFFLIGDSFIQADELDYNNTIYGKLNSISPGSTYALGYASWNPIQYLKAIKKINKKNAHYFIFLFTNDITPSYSRSVYSEIKNFKNDSYFKFVNELFTYKAFRLIKKEFFLKEIVNENKNKFNFKDQELDFSSQEINNCDPLFKIENTEYKKTEGYDYLVFSKNYNCWPKLHQKAYKEFYIKMNEIVPYVRNTLQSKLSIVWVVAGHAFSNQNSIGRNSYEFQFNIGMEISQRGLVEKFSNDFKDLNIIDTEPIIKNELYKCKNNCTDKFFFTSDGHWTANTHSLIFNHLIN